MSISKTIAKNTMFGFIATGADAVAMLLVGIVLARNLGTEQYGLYSLMMWFLSLAGLVVNLGIGEMTKRFVAEAMGQQNKRAANGHRSAIPRTQNFRHPAGVPADSSPVELPGKVIRPAGG